MGSFNMKCALTQLPVRSGDAVVLLIGIKPSHEERRRDYAGGFDYQPHFFKLITTPLFGHYNDYGWIEDIDEASVRAATEFLQAVGYGDAVESLSGDHWHEALEHMTEVVNEVEEGELDPTVGYTFIHRKAWDNLLEYGSQKLTGVSHSLMMDDAAGNIVAEKIRAAGGTDVLFDRFEQREDGYIRGNIRRPQLFQLAMQELGQAIAELPKPETIPDLASKTPEQQAIAKKYASITEGILQDDTFMMMLAGSVDWMRPLFYKRNMSMPKAVHTDRMLAMLEAVKRCSKLHDMLRDIDIVYHALIANQLVIRASTDLPTASQESSYWGVVAVTTAAAEIIHDSASARLPEDKHGAELVEALVNAELASPY